MSATTMELEVIVRLRDMLSRGLDGIGDHLRKLEGLAQRMSQHLSNLGNKLAGLGAGMSIGFTAGMKSAIDFDTSLRDTAITAGLTGQAVEAYVKKTAAVLEQMVARTGQTSSALAESLHDLVAAGVDEAPALKMIDQIGRASTASAAKVMDLTNTSKVLFQSLKIDADQMELALAKLHKAGKLGNFELRDMAQFAPEIAPNLAAIGVTGMDAIAHLGAALQISKMGAGTPGQAATNYKDFVSQITSAHFKHRMEKAGVDVSAVIADAAIKGINPIEAIAQKIIKVTNADKEAQKAIAEAKKRGLSDEETQNLVVDRVSKAMSGSKLGEILINQESKTFFATLAAHVDDYFNYKKEISNTGTGIIDEDFESRMRGPEAKLRMATENIEQAMRRAGNALLPWIDNLGMASSAVLNFARRVDEAVPGLVDALVKLGAAASGVAAALFGLKLLGNMLGGGNAAPSVSVPGLPTGGAGGTGGVAKPGLDTFKTARDFEKFTPDALKEMGKRVGTEGGKDLAKTGAVSLASRVPLILGGVALAGLAAYLLPKTNSTAENALQSSMKDVKWSPELTESMYDKLYSGGRGEIDRIDASEMSRRRGSGQGKAIDVSGQITIKVDGPGSVTAVSSTNPDISIAVDRGQTVNRP
jgi:TP901 family phage tail tape measure protein